MSRLAAESRPLVKALELQDSMPDQKIFNPWPDSSCRSRSFARGDLNAALLLLFDDPENGIFFRWTATEETKEKKHDWPGVMISWLRGVEFAEHVGFAEVKRIEERANNYALFAQILCASVTSPRLPSAIRRCGGMPYSPGCRCGMAWHIKCISDYRSVLLPWAAAAPSTGRE
ncbi:hypothetical protein BCR43DRAFT_518922 [Syncephalastrum racemosum]|uniref:Uncharacterized protein n=1 Tax=Syncephalastrum racemosum TaxID=13706 RepID=A0A1X2H058_SYNRA|nr:hypothetical protein BCR43DRAFT_518922 [Syncephalastrum racemosum]